jgi:predicted lipid carrier protein YhbT
MEVLSFAFARRTNLGRTAGPAIRKFTYGARSIKDKIGFGDDCRLSPGKLYPLPACAIITATFDFAVLTMNSPSRLPLPPSPLELLRGVSRKLLPAVALVPFNLQRAILSPLMEQALKEPLADGDFEFLKDKWLKVDITDAGLCWYFTCAETGELVISQEQQADATIRGNLKDFLQLTARTEDPDTLFFQRRLQIEGDTELGLELKNLLDGVDQDSLPTLLRLLLLQGASVAAALL